MMTAWSRSTRSEISEEKTPCLGTWMHFEFESIHPFATAMAGLDGSCSIFTS